MTFALAREEDKWRVAYDFFIAGGHRRMDAYILANRKMLSYPGLDINVWAESRLPLSQVVDRDSA